MIKISTIEEKDGTRIYVEGQTDADREALDSIYEVIMSKEPKVGGYSSSLQFTVLRLNPKQGTNSG